MTWENVFSKGVYCAENKAGWQIREFFIAMADKAIEQGQYETFDQGVIDQIKIAGKKQLSGTDSAQDIKDISF